MGTVLVYIVSFLLVLSFPPVKTFFSCFPGKCTTSESQENKQTEVTQKLILVLDMDETLIHSGIRVTDSNKEFSVKGNSHDMEFQVTFSELAKYDIRVWKRPYVDQFLQEMAKLYLIYIFTAAKKLYAEKVVDQFSRDCGVTFEGVLTFDDVTPAAYGRHYKDLNKVTTDLNMVLILDNTPEVLSELHKKNLVPIKTWDNVDETTDQALSILETLLVEITKEWDPNTNSDVKKILKTQLNKMSSPNKRLALQKK